MLQKIKEFFDSDLWKKDESEMSKFQRFLFAQARVFTLAIRGFKEDEILLRSSALTFYTLISIVPIVAMAFGISKGFGFEEKLHAQIRASFSNQEQVSELLVNFSHSMLENTEGGLVAGLGFAVLLYSVMKVLSNIELSFNAVWGIDQPRTLIRKFTEYLAIMIIAPVLIVFSGGITIWISSATSNLLDKSHWFNLLGPFVKILLELLPLILNWLLFAFIYLVIPNTKVKFKNALIAGIIAGTGFNLLEWAYFAFQIGAVKYNAVYGSFAALPLFLVWVQSSWLIVLFGCEIAFANQHVKKYLFEKEVQNISIQHQKKITLLLIIYICRRFLKGETPITVKEMATDLKLPIRLIQKVSSRLIETHLLLEVYSEEKLTLGLVPARAIHQMKIQEIITLIENSGSNEIPVKESVEWDLIQKTLEDFEVNLHEHPLNVSLEEILNNSSLK